jgi:hypothetical protein
MTVINPVLASMANTFPTFPSIMSYRNVVPTDESGSVAFTYRHKREIVSALVITITIIPLKRY